MTIRLILAVAILAALTSSCQPSEEWQAREEHHESFCASRGMRPTWVGFSGSGGNSWHQPACSNSDGAITMYEVDAIWPPAAQSHGR